MSEDMSDIMKKISGMINSGNIPDNVKEAMNNINNNNNSNNNNNNNQSKNNSNSDSSSINPELINNIVNMFNSSQNSNSNNSDSSSNSSPNIDIGTIMKMKTIIDKMSNNKNDPRSNLLLSLKPYLRESRKEKVEQYIKLFNMSQVMDILKPNGGDNSK